MRDTGRIISISDRDNSRELHLPSGEKSEEVKFSLQNLPKFKVKGVLKFSTIKVRHTRWPLIFFTDRKRVDQFKLPIGNGHHLCHRPGAAL